MLKQVLHSVREYKAASFLTMFFVIIEVLLEVAIPMLMASIVDVGLAENATSWSTKFIGITISASSSINFILIIGLMMGLMALISLLCGALSGRYAAVASCGFAKNLRQDLFYKVQDFSFGNVDKFSTPSLITRLTHDIGNLQMTYMMVIRVLIRAPFMFVMAIVMTGTIDLHIFYIILGCIPVLAGGVVFFASKAIPRFMKTFEMYDEMNASVQENLIGIRVVKAFVRSGHETKKFKKSADDVRDSLYKAEKILVVAMPLAMIFMFGCIMVVCGLGGVKIIGGTLTTGAFMSMITYITQILMSLAMISFVFVMVVMSKASINRIGEVLKEDFDIKDNEDGGDLEVADGSVYFENVDFSYSKNLENLTLTNINIDIKSGEMVGIVGGTGSAKTTLVQLVPRLYDALEGTVKVGGRDVKDYTLKHLRNTVAMVLQKNVLFSGTIKENLMWGDENASDEEIIDACKKAQAHDFIMSFPDGYETKIEQGGVNVSGGQKQRLCIARALLKKPKILILDDSTSAVDTATDAKIRRAFKNSLADTTVIIIAQRISSISEADKIIVMDDGKISDMGTHAELLQRSMIYKEVYDSQQGDLDA